MAKRVKKTMLGFRADDLFLAQIKDYLEHTDLSAAQMFRRAVDEYMGAHPVKELVPNAQPTTMAETTTVEAPAQT